MRNLITWMLVLFALVVYPFSRTDAQTANAGQAPSSAATASDQSNASRVTAYTLSPELYKKAHDRSRILFRLQLIGFVYGLFVLWAILRWKLSATFRNWAESCSKRRFLQA